MVRLPAFNSPITIKNLLELCFTYRNHNYIPLSTATSVTKEQVCKLWTLVYKLYKYKTGCQSYQEQIHRVQLSDATDLHYQILLCIHHSSMVHSP